MGDKVRVVAPNPPAVRLLVRLAERVQGLRRTPAARDRGLAARKRAFPPAAVLAPCIALLRLRASRFIRTPPFRAAIQMLGLPADARVAEVACGGDARLTLPLIQDLFDARLVAVGHRPDRAAALVELLGERVEIHQRDPRTFDGGPYDLVIVNSGLAGTANALAGMLPTARRLLGPSGRIAVSCVIRTHVNGEPDPGLSTACRAGLDPFFELNFGSLEPTIEQFFAPVRAIDLQVDAIVPAASRADAANPGLAVWALLRPACGRSDDGPRYRSAASAFPLEKTVAWLAALRADGMQFVFPEGLAEIAACRRHGGAPASAPIVLKHDIHHDMGRTMAMAEAEARAGVHGVYLMMGPHELNAWFFDEPDTWESLRRIAALGHRIGLHLDLADTILTHGDLYEGVGRLLERFHREGIEVRYANAHGNTQLGQLGLGPRQLFREFSEAPGSPALSVASELNHHVGRYALAEMASRFGLEYWLDSNVLRAGEPLLERSLYVTDNLGALKTAALRSKPWEIDDAFAEALSEEMRRRDTLILLHPQFHEARTETAPATPVARPSPRAQTRGAKPGATFTPTVYESPEHVRAQDGPHWDFSVTVDGLRYEGRVNQRRRAAHMYVAFHGGVRGAQNLPVLPRWTQHALLGAPILSLFDPLIYDHPSLPGGWYLGDAPRDETPVIARLIIRVGYELGIPAERIICIGNSSGGFAAMRIAAAIGARFIAINSQTEILKYFRSGYEPFSKAFDPERSPEDNAAAHPTRWSAIQAINAARTGGVDVRGTIIQNSRDPHHYEHHAVPYCEAFAIPLDGGTSKEGRLGLILYDGEPGHGPEPAAVARRIATEIGPGLAGV